MTPILKNFRISGNEVGITKVRRRSIERLKTFGFVQINEKVVPILINPEVDGIVYAKTNAGVLAIETDIGRGTEIHASMFVGNRLQAKVIAALQRLSLPSCREVAREIRKPIPTTRRCLNRLAENDEIISVAIDGYRCYQAA